MPHPRILATLALALVPIAPVAAQFRTPDTLTPEQALRFERFEDFQIKGVCGVRDLERLASFGVNTVRGYTIPNAEETLRTLDEAHSLGLKVVVSEWMPHHGENKSRNGSTWSFDYTERGDQMVENFITKIEGIGDHPAILMWGLGNEVHLDEPYLRTVNRMSEAVHARYPHHITSLTMINAKPEHIEAVKTYAPDLDVLGIQSYSPGAVRGSIKKTEELWGKPFYMSEFNGKGPWNFKKTEWGEALDETADRKLADLKACYEAIDASPLCLGSTVFVWGHFGMDRPTFFSLLLADHPDGPAKDTPTRDLYMTPRGEYMIEHFTGKPFPGNRAPILTKLETVDGAKSLSTTPGAEIGLSLAATDPDADAVTYRVWILDSKPARGRTIAGPYEVDASGDARFSAPNEPGQYLIMTYAIDQNGGASASTLPLQIK